MTYKLLYFLPDTSLCLFVDEIVNMVKALEYIESEAEQKFCHMWKSLISLDIRFLIKLPGYTIRFPEIIDIG